MIFFAILLFFQIFTPKISSSCPSLPYTPPNNFNYNPRYIIDQDISWDFVCEDWNLPLSDKIVIGLKARGSGGYVGIFNEINTKKFEFTVFFGNEFQIFKDEKLKLTPNYYNSQIAQTNASDLNEYIVIFDRNDSSITVAFNGKIALICSDEFSIEKLKFVSFSQVQKNFTVYQVEISTKMELKLEKIWPERKFLQKNENEQVLAENDILSIALFFGSMLLIGVFKLLVNKFLGKA